MAPQKHCAKTEGVVKQHFNQATQILEHQFDQEMRQSYSATAFASNVKVQPLSSRELALIMTSIERHLPSSGLRLLRHSRARFYAVRVAVVRVIVTFQFHCTAPPFVVVQIRAGIFARDTAVCTLLAVLRDHHWRAHVRLVRRRSMRIRHPHAWSEVSWVVAEMWRSVHGKVHVRYVG